MLDAMTDQPSQKQRIMAHLVARANGERPFAHGTRDTDAKTRRKGWTGATVTTISTDLGISPHDVTHALHDLRHRGLLKFAISKNPGRNGAAGTGGSTPMGGIPVRIMVTDLGLASETVDETPEVAPVVVPEPQPTLPPDMTPEPPPPTEAPAADPPLPGEVMEAYPVIRSVIERQRIVKRVVADLQSIGMHEVADLALHEATYTPLEEEVAAHVREVREVLMGVRILLNYIPENEETMRRMLGRSVAYTDRLLLEARGEVDRALDAYADRLPALNGAALHGKTE